MRGNKGQPSTTRGVSAKTSASETPEAALNAPFETICAAWMDSFERQKVELSQYIVIDFSCASHNPKVYLNCTNHIRQKKIKI